MFAQLYEGYPILSTEILPGGPATKTSSYLQPGIERIMRPIAEQVHCQHRDEVMIDPAP
ncbi:MAG TPA: hypothetical protein VLK82_13545 [Candidatus Tectomicrobia bacterium]|nr:hypothetical protein [Candidatus Tectomicrobia bacterium]